MGSERTLADKLQVLDQKQECWVARETGATSKIKAPKKHCRFFTDLWETIGKEKKKKKKKQDPNLLLVVKFNPAYYCKFWTYRPAPDLGKIILQMFSSKFVLFYENWLQVS